MANKSLVIVSSFIGEPFESIGVDVSDSDSWQVIDTSGFDDRNFSYGDITTTNDEENDSVASDVSDLLQHRYGSSSSDISMQSLVDEIDHHCQEAKDVVGVSIADEDNLYEHEGDKNDDEEEEEENNDDDDYDDLDDDEVPKWLNKKF